MHYKNLAWILEELKFHITLALPPSVICLTDGLQVKLSNVFIGRVSGENITSMLSALFIGQIFIGFTAYSISEGLSISVNILCSQAYGKKQLKLVGLYYYRVLLLMILICFPLFSLLISVGPIVHFFTQDNELSLGAGTYTSIYCFGFPAYAYYYTSIRFLQSQNIVWGPLFYLIIGSVVNGILQYILILHYNLGIAGAACAYVMSIYLIALLVFAHIRFSRVHISTKVGFDTELISEWFHTAKYVLPSIIQVSIAMIANSVFPIIILLLVCNNKDQLALYSIMYSVWFVYSLFAMGYTSSLTVRVGQLLGENDIRKAKRSAIFGIICGEMTLFVICIAIMLLSKPLSQLFTTDQRFANELHYNLLALPVITLSDIMLFGQGITNACRMQHIHATFKFVFLFVFGFVGEYILVKFFPWKALCLFMIQGLANILCFAVCMTIIFTRNWDTFVLRVVRSNKFSNDRIGIRDPSVATPDSDNPSSQHRNGILMNICGCRIYIVFRYIACFSLGCLLFSIVYLTLPM